MNIERVYFVDCDLLCDAVESFKRLRTFRRKFLTLFSGLKDRTLGENSNLARQIYFPFGMLMYEEG
jgi:hypothetical protein